MSNNLFHHEQIYRGDLSKLSKKILICGCGAVGSNLIDNLNRQGCCNLSVIDFDRIEKHNINTQAFNSVQVGMLKVAGMEQLVYETTNCILSIESKELTAANAKKLLKGYDLIIDGFDNTKARQIVYDYGKQNKIPVLHIGLFEDYAEIIWNERYTVPQVQEGLDVCDYPLARNIITLAIGVSSEEVVRFCFGQEINNWLITLKDFKIRKL